MNFWPEDYQGAISLSFDDGLASQLEFALPALNDRSLQATFYLNPSGKDENPDRRCHWREFLAAWLSAHRMGHELGNHTLMHPCSLNINIDTEWRAGINLRDWTLERLEADVLEAQRRLMEVFPAQTHTSFGYTCYESEVGHGSGRVSSTPMIARHFVAARARGEMANDPLFCDLHHLSSWPGERQAGAFLIGLLELTLARGRWGIFTFHGIQEGHLPVGSTDFIELLDHLVRRRGQVWTAPVATIGHYIQQNRSA